MSPVEHSNPTLEEIERVGKVRCTTCAHNHKFDSQLFTCRHCKHNPLTHPCYDFYKEAGE